MLLLLFWSWETDSSLSTVPRRLCLLQDYPNVRNLGEPYIETGALQSWEFLNPCLALVNKTQAGKVSLLVCLARSSAGVYFLLVHRENVLLLAQAGLKLWSSRFLDCWGYGDVLSSWSRQLKELHLFYFLLILIGCDPFLETWSLASLGSQLPDGWGFPLGHSLGSFPTGGPCLADFSQHMRWP